MEAVASAPDPHAALTPLQHVLVGEIDAGDPLVRTAVRLLMPWRTTSVADVLGRSPQAARQLASRARRRVRGASWPGDGGASRGRQVVEAWLAAVQGGDLGGLLELLDEGAVLRADYGDRLRVVEGAARIADQARTAARLAAHSVPVLLDGRPGVAAVLEGRLVSLMAFDIDDGRIVGLDVLADPDRLREVDVDRLLVD